jgi:hypothetical protein
VLTFFRRSRERDPTAILLEPKPIRSRTETNSLRPGTALDGRNEQPYNDDGSSDGPEASDEKHCRPATSGDHPANPS